MYARDFEFVSFCQRFFDYKKICDVPLSSHFVSDNNNPSRYIQ